jgi:hypothetical protein
MAHGGPGVSYGVSGVTFKEIHVELSPGIRRGGRKTACLSKGKLFKYLGWLPLWNKDLYSHTL